ncbi:glutathione S-transferase family protein [Rhizobium mesosinicum]|uniref:Glutathione S-transferase family protein n=1 Tax=Rhizobium mesosinicum TaxID=335017 RepID=A0ABS7GNB6_9HYPH|nr:glutathione S-transferase family protein [Rhizobium mesosinicum]MBW9051146.1 glutathione S-transferase family protein [Rhizobium mesosinicum]
MELLYTRFSPFSRKVLILAHERGLHDRLELRPVEVGTHVPLKTSAHDELSGANPLVKIPVLQTVKYGPLYDSRVICEYLDTLHSLSPVFPAIGRERWEALRQQATADGIVDAALLIRFEKTRLENRVWEEWAEAQTRRMRQGLDALEEAAASLGRDLTVGQISIAAALGYLDFRFDALQWRSSRPVLADWFDRFSSRASMESTKPT